MTAKNNQTNIVHLIIDKSTFKEKVNNRLILGNEIITREINNETEEKKCWDAFIDWDNYNLELIKHAFDNPNNSYVIDYERDTSHVGAIFGNYKEPSFREKIESLRKEMGYQVRKLKWFYEKIELLREGEQQLIKKVDIEKTKFDELIHLLTRFHKVVQELRERHADRNVLTINDEYDIHYILNALLRLYFNDIRKEEYSPSNSGANSRLDFVLKQEQIIIEVKMTSEKLKTSELGAQLLVDIGRYKSYPSCSNLVIFIYDKGDHIINKKGFSDDLDKQSTNTFKITTIIIPE